MQVLPGRVPAGRMQEGACECFCHLACSVIALWVLLGLGASASKKRVPDRLVWLSMELCKNCALLQSLQAVPVMSYPSLLFITVFAFSHSAWSKQCNSMLPMA